MPALGAGILGTVCFISQCCSRKICDFGQVTKSLCLSVPTCEMGTIPALSLWVAMGSNGVHVSGRAGHRLSGWEFSQETAAMDPGTRVSPLTLQIRKLRPRARL